MADVIQNKDLDENKPKGPVVGQQVQPVQNQQQPQAPATGQQPGPASGSQPSQSPQKPYNPNQQRGSGYTNINRIVQANQANKLGQTIGSNIQQAGQQTRQNLQQAGAQFQQQAEQNRFDTAQNQQLVQDVIADPTKYANLGQNTAESQAGGQFAKLISGTYQGPMGLQNASQLQAQAQDIGQLGQAIGSQGGRMGLLQRFVGSPQYQAGQQRLDALLLGQTGGKQLGEARKAAMGLENVAKSQIGGAAATGQELANRAQQFGQDVQGQFSQTLEEQNKRLQEQASKTQEQRDAEVKAAQEALASGTLTQDLASQLGIQGDQMTYGIDPTKFLNPSAVQASAQNVASQQDYARINALRQLGGTSAPQAAQNILSQFEGQDKQAGGLDKAFTADKEGYQKAYQQAKQDYESKLGAAVGQTQSATAIRDEISQLADQSRAIRTPEDAQAYQQHYQEFLSRTGLNPSGGLQRMHEWSILDNLNRAQANEAAVRQLLQQQYGDKTFKVQ